MSIYVQIKFITVLKLIKIYYNYNSYVILLKYYKRLLRNSLMLIIR